MSSAPRESMPVNASTKVKEKKKKKKKREKNDGYAPADSVESVTMGQHYPLVVVDESVKFAGPASTSVSYERTNEQKKKAAARQDSGKKPDQGVAIKKVSVGSYIKMYSEGQNKKKFKYAVYAMEVQNAKGKTWQIHKRFSELHGFHSRLMSREVNKNDCDWGGFPEKKWNFCSLTDHSSVKFLDERKASLNKWLTQVFRSRKITKAKYKVIVDSFFLSSQRFSMLYPGVHSEKLDILEEGYDDEEPAMPSLESQYDALDIRT